MAELSIRIFNRRGADATFFVFVGSPVVTGNNNIFQNAYLVQTTPNNTDATFTWTVNRSALCGHQVLGLGTMINQSADTPVILGTGGIPGTTTAVIVNNAEMDASFQIPNPPAAAPDGEFGINVGGGFHVGAPYYIGIGSPGPNGQIIPTCVFNALPETDYLLQPLTQYFLSVGECTATEIVDVNATGPQLQLNFAAGNALIYTLDNTNTYHVGPPPAL